MTYIQDKLQTYLHKEKDKLCIIDNIKIKSLTCNIDDIKIHNISYFLANILPNNNNKNIILNNIKNGIIIGKGEFGYSFKIINNNKESYIIKIIICQDTNYDKVIRDEIEMNKQISFSNNNYYIKLLSYYEYNPKNNEYISYYLTKNMYTIKKIKNKKILFNNYHTMCEKYLLLEAGEYDLMKYSILKNTNLNINEKINESKKIINLFYELLQNFYKISEYFLQKTQLFTHNDIKLENMVLVNNKIKLIDFGQSKLINKFNDRGTIQQIISEILFEEKIKYKRISILTDIFSLILSALYSIYIINKYEKNNEKITYEILKEKTKIISNNEQLNKIILLGDIIFSFYRIIIKYHEIKLSESSESSESYDSLIDIQNLNYTNLSNKHSIINKEDQIYLNILNIFDELKLKTKPQVTNKLINDYNYIDNIIKNIIN